MIARLANLAWRFSYDLELARQEHAEAGKLWRQAAACVALAIVRLAGLRI